MEEKALLVRPMVKQVEVKDLLMLQKVLKQL